MADLDDDGDVEEIILASSTLIFSNCAIILNELLKKRRRHSVWVQGYLQCRRKYGAYNCLMRDLEVHAEEKLKNYIRMDVSTFEELFTLIEPMISKRRTKFR